MLSNRQPKYRQKLWDGDVQHLDCLGNGISGIVFAIDSTRVVKIHLGTPRSVEDFETERAVYRRFGERLAKGEFHYVLRCLDLHNPRGLVLERCHETVRGRVRAGNVEEGQVLRWAKQAAEGLAWIHDCKVIQSDVGCHNMLLDSSDNIKLADFAGSSIDESDVSINYEVRSRLPSMIKPNKKSDIFALGSALYEMATGRRPYEKLSYGTIQNLYRKGDFPRDVDVIPELGKVIRKCWEQCFDSAWDVVRLLEETESGHRPPSRQQRSDVDVDPAILLEKKNSEPSKMYQNSADTYIHETSQRRRKSRRERYVESGTSRKVGKKQSQSDFSSWLNRSMPSWTKSGRNVHEKQCNYYRI